MTISTESSVVTYIGNGSTTSFPFSFVGVSQDDISVVFTDSSGNQSTLDPTTYTLILTPAAPGELWGIGGTVTYPNSGSPIALNTQLSIIRNVPYIQDVSIDNQGAFYPKAVEQGLDLLELQLQQVNTDVTYSIKTPITDPAPPGVLPPAAERANLYLGFDSLGQPTVLEGVPGTGGNVSSVALSAPPEFVVTGSPITNSGTLTLTKATESSGTVYAGPTSGSPAQPTFRTLVPGDLPVATTGAVGASRPDGTSISISGGVLSVASSLGANPTATAGPLAINGTSSKFMRSDAAPAVQLGSSSQKGIVQVDGTTIAATSGVISVIPSVGAVTTTGSPATNQLTKFSGSQTITNGDLSGDITTSGSLITTLATSGVTAGSYGDATNIPTVTVNSKGLVTAASNNTFSVPTGANPTATAGNTAVNGTATTFMRSDAAPAIQLASASVFGIAKVDGTTITASSGILTVAAGTAQMAFWIEGTMTNAEKVISLATSVPYNLLTATTSNWKASADTASTGNVSFTINKNGSSIGSVTFNASSTGSFTFSTNTAFSVGDIFDLTAPSTADATLANVRISFVASL